MKKVLGIEGGGTKTEWLYREPAAGAGTGATMRKGVLPAANLRLIGDAALEQLFAQLPREPDAVGVFLAGCVDEADRRRLLALARKAWPQAAIRAGSDRQSGFAAAFHGGDGVAVISGTGSAITGRSGSREDAAGGWGHLLGDKGSGYDLAMQALRHVLWHYDLTREVIAPGEAMLAALGLNRLPELVAWAAQAQKMEVAQLAPVVFQAAGRGDAAMREILRSGAAALAAGACAVAGRLGLAPAPVIRLQGGIFEHNPEYRERFRREVAQHYPQADIALCGESGAVGAAWLAAQEAEPEGEAAAIPAVELSGADTEQANPRSEKLDMMSTPEIVDLFTREEAEVMRALEAARESLVAGIDLCAAALGAGGRLFYVGAGTSGRLGVLDASEIPPTFGTDPALVQGIMAGGARALLRSAEGGEDYPEAGALAMRGRGVRPGDVVCGIAASGRTPFVLGALEEAGRLGAHTLLLSCNPARPRHGRRWEVEIDLPTGPELLTGSTRLKAGTATKCALNLLSTATMVRLGKVRGNAMSHVRASNAKLRDRAIRLVSRLGGVSRAEAQARLEAHEWEVEEALR